MSNEIMQENTPFVECSAFHRGMSVLEASLRNTEDSDAIISCLLKGAAEFYGASRASVVEADWDLGIGVITYEWCKDGVPAQRDMLQCLPMEKFPRWRKALRANKPVVISDLQRLEKVYPDEAAFFREYGVTTLLAAPFSKRINQGFIAVDDPTRYTDDPVFLFIASYAVVVELNEIKQQQSLLAATKASKYNPEDIHINFFGGMEIINSKGTLTGEDIKADQCYHFFTMGGAKSHDTEDGILEPGAPDFERKLLMLQRKPRARYRINHISWWAQEMPSEEEYAEARKNLAKVDWAVDYVITHCAPTSIALMENRHNEADPLTDFLQEVKERAHYHYWLFGHYHDNRAIDEKHILLWEQIVQVI